MQPMLVALAQAWASLPDVRLMQLLLNIAGPGDQYYLEDDVLYEKILEWIHDSETFDGGQPT